MVVELIGPKSERLGSAPRAMAGLVRDLLWMLWDRRRKRISGTSVLVQGLDGLLPGEVAKACCAELKERGVHQWTLEAATGEESALEPWRRLEARMDGFTRIPKRANEQRALDSGWARTMISRLLDEARNPGAVLFVEGIEWLDPASAALVHAAAWNASRRDGRMAVLGVHRVDPVDPFSRLLGDSASWAQHFRVPVPPNAVLERVLLAEYQLGARDPEQTETLRHRIASLADGNLLTLRNIVLWMRHRGVLQQDAGALTPIGPALDSLPDAASRVNVELRNYLRPAEQSAAWFLGLVRRPISVGRVATTLEMEGHGALDDMLNMGLLSRVSKRVRWRDGGLHLQSLMAAQDWTELGHRALGRMGDEMGPMMEARLRAALGDKNGVRDLLEALAHDAEERSMWHTASKVRREVVAFSSGPERRMRMHQLSLSAEQALNLRLARSAGRWLSTYGVDRPLRAQGALMVARSEMGRGRWRAALNWAAKAREWAEREDGPVERDARMVEGRIAVEQGKLERGEQLLRLSLGLSDRTNYPVGRSRARRWLARLRMLRDDPDGARRLLRQALRDAEESGNEVERALVQAERARLNRQQGAMLAGLDLARAALDRAQRALGAGQVLELELETGLLLQSLGHMEAAASLLGAAAEQRHGDGEGSPDVTIRALVGLGRVRIAGGRVAEALESLEQAASLAKQHQREGLLVRARSVLALFWSELGLRSLAQRTLKDLPEIAEPIAHVQPERIAAQAGILRANDAAQKAIDLLTRYRERRDLFGVDALIALRAEAEARMALGANRQAYEAAERLLEDGTVMGHRASMARGLALMARCGPEAEESVRLQGAALMASSGVDSFLEYSAHERLAEQPDGLATVFGVRATELRRALIQRSPAALQERISAVLEHTGTVVDPSAELLFSDPMEADLATLSGGPGRHIPSIQEEVGPLLPVGQRTLVLRSRAARRAYADAVAAAEEGRPVLILGERGSGRALLAQAVHEHSRRREGPFLRFSAEVDDHEVLIPWLLDGLDRGGQGTLLIESADSLSKEEQNSISQHILSIAETRRPRLVATARPRSDQSWLSPDLAEILGPLQVNMPSLSERTSDQAEIAGVLLEELAEREGCPVPLLTASARSWMLGRRWRGQVREMRQLLSQVLGRSVVDAEDLERALVGDVLPGPLRPRAESIQGLQELHHQELRSLVLDAVQAAEGNKSKAARELGISRQAMYRILENQESGSG